MTEFDYTKHLKKKKKKPILTNFSTQKKEHFPTHSMGAVVVP